MTRNLALILAFLGLECGEQTTDLLLVGTVERTLIELVAPSAETIVEVRVQRGQPVEADQLLLMLDTTFSAAEVARSQAALAGARTGAVVAEQELERIEKLRRDRVASEQQLDRARLGRDEALARLHEAEAVLLAAHKRHRDLHLTSPVAGVVDQIPFDLGERPPSGAVVAVVLADEKPWVRVWIPETGVARVGPGTPAEIEIDGVEGTLRGSVADVARQPEFTPHYALTERDRVHLVYETRVRILNAPPALRPGVPARVRLNLDGALAQAEP